MPSDLSPTARALRALEVLQYRPGCTAGELAQRLGVTDRAARRYVAILREAGIPVVSTRGPHGGYRVGRGTRLPPVVFTQDEALGLVMAVLDGQPQATHPDDLVGGALGKVIRALPESIGREAAALRDHAAAVPDRRSARPDPAITSALVSSVAARHGVRLRYRSESGNEWEAHVDPWAVVVRHSRWYLLCHSHSADDVRTYRIDRVLEVAETGQPFTPPDGLDAAALLEEKLGTGWEYPTQVTFEATVEEVAPWVPGPMGRLEAVGDRCVLVGSTSNPAMYAGEWLARLPFTFHVDGGPELRQAVTVLAQRLTSAVPRGTSTRKKRVS